MKKSKPEFSTVRGSIFIIVLIAIVSILALYGLAKIGAIALPSFITDIFSGDASEQITGDKILPDGSAPDDDLVGYMHADEYADALSSMSQSQNYYHKYKIVLYADNISRTRVFTLVCDGERFWVQQSADGGVVRTATCDGVNVRIEDNTNSAGVLFKKKSDEYPNGISLSDEANLPHDSEVLSWLKTLASGGEVTTPLGKILSYETELTQSQTNNVIGIKYEYENGQTDEYSYEFESGILLSCRRYKNGELYYDMTSLSFTTDMTMIDVEDLFK